MEHDAELKGLLLLVSIAIMNVEHVTGSKEVELVRFFKELADQADLKMAAHYHAFIMFGGAQYQVCTKLFQHGKIPIFETNNKLCLIKCTFAMTDIQRAIRNRMAFLNIFHKARPKEAARSMQYICILVLYNIIGWAFERRYTVLKELFSTQEGGAKA